MSTAARPLWSSESKSFDLCKIHFQQDFLTVIWVSRLCELSRNDKNPSFTSLLAYFFHKKSTKTHSYGNRPFMMPQRARIPNWYVSQGSDKHPRPGDRSAFVRLPHDAPLKTCQRCNKASILETPLRCHDIANHPPFYERSTSARRANWLKVHRDAKGARLPPQPALTFIAPQGVVLILWLLCVHPTCFSVYRHGRHYRVQMYSAYCYNLLCLYWSIKAVLVGRCTVMRAAACC